MIIALVLNSFLNKNKQPANEKLIIKKHNKIFTKLLKLEILKQIKIIIEQQTKKDSASKNKFKYGKKIIKE